jgi:hypothetical protein
LHDGEAGPDDANRGRLGIGYPNATVGGDRQCARGTAHRDFREFRAGRSIKNRDAVIVGIDDP